MVCCAFLIKQLSTFKNHKLTKNKILVKHINWTRKQLHDDMFILKHTVIILVVIIDN